LPANQKIRGRQSLPAFVLATLATLTIASRPVFADISPQFANNAVSASVADQRVQLAEANLPPVGSVDDYMQEGNPNGGASGAGGYQPQGVPPQGYQPQGAPPQGYYPPQEYYGSADPNAERSALIGAAVVGAVAVGVWAWQQHQMLEAQRQATLQAQRQARKQSFPKRRAYNNQIE
jgi:hypothetical protein